MFSPKQNLLGKQIVKSIAGLCSSETADDENAKFVGYGFAKNEARYNQSAKEAGAGTVEYVFICLSRTELSKIP